MVKKSCLIAGVLLVFTLLFVSSASYPAPFELCEGVKTCPDGFRLVPDGSVIFMNGLAPRDIIEKEDNCGQNYRCLRIIQQITDFQKYVNTISSSTTTEIEGDVVALEFRPAEGTQDRRDCEKNGCFERGGCYPYGYVKEKRYCYERHGIGIRPLFLNQSKMGQICNQSYECETGLCSDALCVNLTEQQIKLNLLNVSLAQLAQELKQNISEEENKTSNLDVPNFTISPKNESGNLSLDAGKNKINTNDTFFKKVLNWFKKFYT